jgi:hypothetical protein
MFPSKLRLLRTVGLAVFAVGCGALLGVSPPDPSDGETGGNGKGDTKTGGHAGNGGTGATGQGGTSGGGEAGEGSGGSPMGGASPAGGHAMGGEPAGNGGAAGDDGAGGEPDWVFPEKGAACSVPGALACAAAHSISRYICKGGVWQKADDCPTGQQIPERCDRTTGTCGLQVCTDAGARTCEAGDSRICGPDEATWITEPCPFGCLPSGACDGPADYELLIDRPGPLRTPTGAWPNPLIPVCWQGPETDAMSDSARVVRETVETTWGRFSSVGFPGWDTCGDKATGVELRFVNRCEGELARVPFLGYPGPSATLPVELCTSYLDAGLIPDEVQVSDELLGLVALHVFGHVLGFEDLKLDVGVMEPVVDLRTYEQITLDAEDITWLQFVYGSKPSHSLVGPNGRCLAFASGTLSSAACDGSAAQRFQPGPAELAHDASESCVRRASDSGEAIEFAPCTGDASREGFLTHRVRWQVSRGRYEWQVAGGSRCAAVRPPMPNESPLAVMPCDSSWPAAQEFGFEFLDGDRVRIHSAATGYCVTSPNTWTSSFPGLGTCGGGQDVLDVTSGRLGVAGHCLAGVHRGSMSGLEFLPCSASYDQHFALSGPIALGKSALTLLNVEPPELTLTALVIPPLPSQIFDYHL